jgi:DNA-3-methyladenine glycosylase I
MPDDRHDQRSGDLVTGPDGRVRCWWAAGSTGLAHYHDHEWGRGSREEHALFERLSLEAFQAGLSWRIVLERRDALREAFAGFDPLAVAAYGAADVERLLGDVRLIRNRAKMAAVVANARLLSVLHAQGVLLKGLTDEALASAAEGQRPPPRLRTDVPARTVASTALARDLQRRGWRFIGPTTAYAYLQAAGWVDDHLLGCHARGLR